MRAPRDALHMALWTTAIAFSVVFVPALRAEPVKVGDVTIDPSDFAPDRDPETRLAPCLACHGDRAGGDLDFGPEVDFGTPGLRGLDADYIRRSLTEYRQGLREHEEMQTISAMLDDDAIAFMAEAFTAYPGPEVRSEADLAALAEADPLFREGRTIAMEGAADGEVPACASCHGDEGEGVPDLGPHLAGQVERYLAGQLAAYADGTRGGEQAEIMQPIAAGLSERQAEAVVRYYRAMVETSDP